MHGDAWIAGQRYAIARANGIENTGNNESMTRR